MCLNFYLLSTNLHVKLLSYILHRKYPFLKKKNVLVFGVAMLRTKHVTYFLSYVNKLTHLKEHVYGYPFMCGGFVHCF